MKKLKFIILFSIFTNVLYSQYNDTLVLKSFEDYSEIYRLKFSDCHDLFCPILTLDKSKISKYSLNNFINNKKVLIVSYTESLNISEIVIDNTQIAQNFFNKNNLDMNFVSTLSIDKNFDNYYNDLNKKNISKSPPTINDAAENSYVTYSRLKEITAKIYKHYIHNCEEIPRESIDSFVSYAKIDKDCYDKASLVRKFFTNDSIFLKKIFLDGMLWYGEYNGIAKYWQKHAALLANVNQGELNCKGEKIITQMVIDFSFSHLPMDLKSWINIICKNSYSRYNSVPKPSSYNRCIISSGVFRLVKTSSAYSDYSRKQYIYYQTGGRYSFLIPKEVTKNDLEDFLKRQCNIEEK